MFQSSVGLIRPPFLRYPQANPIFFLGESPFSWAAFHSFSTLCVVQINDHSAWTLVSPRRRNCLNPRACLI